MNKIISSISALFHDLSYEKCDKNYFTFKILLTQKIILIEINILVIPFELPLHILYRPPFDPY